MLAPSMPSFADFIPLQIGCEVAVCVDLGRSLSGRVAVRAFRSSARLVRALIT